MKNILSVIHNLHKDESGQDLIEYALVAALIALAATVGMNSLATGINSAFGTIKNRLSDAVAAPSAG